MKQAQVDEGVNQRVQVGNGAPIAKVRAFNAQRKSLAVDPLNCRALAVDILVSLALSVESVT